MSGSIVEISVHNWDKFNPRNDRTNYTWFRFQNDFFTDNRIFGLNRDEKVLFIFVVCEVSRSNSHVAKFSVDYASALLGLKQSRILTLLRTLKKSDLIECDLGDEKPAKSRRDAVTTPSRLLATYERNVTNVTNVDSPTQSGAGSPTTEIKNAFLESYRNEFKRDYPGWGAKENAMASRWLKSVSKDKALELCALYPKWNDQFVVRRGHPFELLSSQYVQMEAWAKSSNHLIQKIAQGKAAENIDLKRAIENEELERGLKHRLQSNRDNKHSQGIPKRIPFSAAKGLPGNGVDSHGSEVHTNTNRKNYETGS